MLPEKPVNIKKKWHKHSILAEESTNIKKNRLTLKKKRNRTNIALAEDSANIKK